MHYKSDEVFQTQPLLLIFLDILEHDLITTPPLSLLALNCSLNPTPTDSAFRFVVRDEILILPSCSSALPYAMGYTFILFFQYSSILSPRAYLLPRFLSLLQSMFFYLFLTHSIRASATSGKLKLKTLGLAGRWSPNIRNFNFK